MPASSTTLRSLPAEIRLQCLSYLPSWDFASYAQTCRLLNNDLDPELSSSLDISLTIDPANISAVKVTLDKEGEGESRELALGGPLLLEHPFINAPFDEFRSITIIIMRPDQSDPGQMVSAFNHLNGILNMISPRWKDGQPPSGPQDIIPPPGCKTTRLPDINISLRNIPHTSGTGLGSTWGPFTRLSCHVEEVPYSCVCRDVDVLLTTLQRLRNCRSCTVTVPRISARHEKHLETGIKTLSALATSQTPHGLYGLYNFETDPMPTILDTDSIIQSEIDAYSVWYHYKLPTMEGPTAAKLRQRHYSSGYGVRSRLFREAVVGREHPNLQMRYSVDPCDWGLQSVFGGVRYNDDLCPYAWDIEALLERVNRAGHVSSTAVTRAARH